MSKTLKQAFPFLAGLLAGMAGFWTLVEIANNYTEIATLTFSGLTLLLCCYRIVQTYLEGKADRE